MFNFEGKKIRVGILGATGMVGQQYIRLLQAHPWFEVTYLAASARSAGKSYAEATAGRWLMNDALAAHVGALDVYEVTDVAKAAERCDMVFSCFEIPDKEEIKRLEDAHAAAGLPVVSNASAHRWTEDVPMLIPEINADHLALIDAQRAARGYDRGFVLTKPNCSLQSYMAPLYALRNAGHLVNKLMVTTLQAVSGGGYPGVPSLDMIDNIVPHIGGEEDKSEREPLKILGHIQGSAIEPAKNLSISATCTRVPVIDGHTASVSIGFAGEPPSIQDIERILAEFVAEPQSLALPSAPVHPIHITQEDNRPQPRKDRDADKGMAVTVGRLRACSVLDYKFVALSHNTMRGAAGGGVLNAEFLVAKGFIQRR